MPHIFPSQSFYTCCVPLTMTVFGLKDLLNDPGCKVVIYTYRVSRSLSVCVTCMLSVFQAVTLSPAASPRWSSLKARLPSLLLPTFVGLWFLNMAVCIAARLFKIGRASCREECLRLCRSRWSPYH